ncbi:hypothetical protein [Bradyrhizobium sp. 164]|uniref:hypothetical protein n=1 Tax=Bradyrhizobium sp. 164 TaxID=2782637 RepID=UPI001FFB2C84|nr:hypothetical protein [Bradyrhizobium sp. 164]
MATAAKQVPLGPDWIHELKRDGYPMLVMGQRVRAPALSMAPTGPGVSLDCLGAALKNRQKRFVIDGEAVILGLDGISDFNALHSRYI